MAKRSTIKESSAPEDDVEGETEEPRRRSRPASRSGSRRRGPRGWWRALKGWWRDARRLGLPVLFVLALAFFVLGIAAVWAPTAFGPEMAGFYSSMGGFASYFFLLALLVFASVGYVAGAYLTKLREFSRLVGTKSKGDFIRTQDKIERLAFELGTHQQDEVTARKKEFRIRH